MQQVTVVDSAAQTKVKQTSHRVTVILPIPQISSSSLESQKINLPQSESYRIEGENQVISPILFEDLFSQLGKTQNLEIFTGSKIEKGERLEDYLIGVSEFGLCSI